MQSPPLLKKGDQIRILSTARSAKKSDLKPAQRLLESWGMRVSYGESIDQVHHQFAGTTDVRRSDLQDALDDPDISAIWCARGGYGTIQIIDELDFSGFTQNPKWIMGYSDVTVLHRKMQTLGYQSLHCFMPLELDSNDVEAQVRFRESVTTTPKPINVSGASLQKPISGKLVGGNLSILYSLLGSDLMEMNEDSILFVEEIDEYVYHIERMMYALKRTGILSKVRAVLVGGLTDMRDHETPFGKSAEQIIQDMCDSTGTPVVFGLPVGHVSNHQALILSAETTIDNTSLGIEILQKPWQNTTN